MLLEKIIEITNTQREIFLDSLKMSARILKEKDLFKIITFDKEDKEKEISFYSKDQLEKFLNSFEISFKIYA